MTDPEKQKSKRCFDEKGKKNSPYFFLDLVDGLCLPEEDSRIENGRMT